VHIWNTMGNLFVQLVYTNKNKLIKKCCRDFEENSVCITLLCLKLLWGNSLSKFQQSSIKDYKKIIKLKNSFKIQESYSRFGMCCYSILHKLGQ
jgi:hypothetical protein